VRRTLATATVLLASLGAVPRPTAGDRPPPTPAPQVVSVPPLTPARVIARYAAALAALAAPRFVTYEYAVQQAGPHNIDQWHRVYRTVEAERNETLSADGVAYKHPEVRIARGRVDRYGIARIAPRADAYALRFVRARRVGAHDDYVFAAQPRAARAFRVTQVTIDGIRFLPTVVAFETRSGGGSIGRGEFRYALSQRYWMIRQAFVAATYAGAPAQERIVWMHYRFPAQLPPTTFAAPRILPALVAPGASPAPGPAATAVPPPHAAPAVTPRASRYRRRRYRRFRAYPG